MRGKAGRQLGFGCRWSGTSIQALLKQPLPHAYPVICDACNEGLNLTVQAGYRQIAVLQSVPNLFLSRSVMQVTYCVWTR